MSFTKKKVVLAMGTRPEVIKLAPVYHELAKSETLEPLILATAQHREMLDQAMKVFGLVPEFDLDLMQQGQTLSDLTARIVTSVSGFFSANSVDAVIVQGDTTTVLGTALSAFYHDLPVGHVEAGLRTKTIRSPFPEEMNRRLTTPLCNWNFTPTELGRENLLREGVSPDSIFVTGNTVIDSLESVLGRKRIESQQLFDQINIPADFRGYLDKKWILMTGHRRESFGGGFENLCEAVNKLTSKFPDLGVLFPVHLNPRVRESVMPLLGENKQVCLIEPVNYEEFSVLMSLCTLILSDSGGVQEEAPSLGKPVLVTRETTERPEGVDAGTCTLVGTDPEKIVKEASILLEDPEEYERRSSIKNPYGDGTASVKIREILERELS